MRIIAADRLGDRSYKTLLVVCCSISFVCYFGSYMRLPVVPIYAKTLGADTMQIGLINSAFLLMAGLLSLPLGMVSDRVGKRLLSVAGLILLAATSFLLCFSSTPGQLVAIYLSFGIGLAAFGPTMMSIVADISPTTHLGRSYGWYTTALYAGMSFGPAVGGFVAQEMGFQRVFILSGCFILLTSVLVFVFLPETRTRNGNRKKASASAAEFLKNRPLLACWLATLGGCFGLGMFITFVPLHAQNQHLSLKEIGLIFTIQGLSNGLSRIPFGSLSDRVADRRNLVTIGLIGFVASVAGFGISTGIASFLGFAALLGVSMGLAFTSVGALIAEAVPAESRGLAMGGYNTCIYLGMMLSSLAMGAVIEKTGFAEGFFLTALFNVLVIVGFYGLMKDFAPVLRPAPTPDR